MLKSWKIFKTWFVGSWWIWFIFRNKYLKGIYRFGNDKPIDILNNVKRIDYFPNAYIPYRKMITISV